MTPGQREIRPLQPGDDLDAELDLRDRAFGPVDAGQRDRWVTGLQTAMAEGRLFGAFDGPQLIGSARFLDMRQWWRGRSLPMAGVAGVKVAPEHRGRGTGTALMAELLAEIARRGYPVSVLYPATASIYRSLGWELAGAQYQTVLPTRSLVALIDPDSSADGPAGRAEPGADPAGPGRGGILRPDRVLRRAGPADAIEVVAVLSAVHAAAGDSGPVTREMSVFRDWLGDPGHFAYLAADGFLAYRWAHGHREILVNRAVAGSARTARAIWGVVAGRWPWATAGARSPRPGRTAPPLRRTAPSRSARAAWRRCTRASR